MTTIEQRQRTCSYCSIEFKTLAQMRAHWTACPVRVKHGYTAPSELAALRARVAELEARIAAALAVDAPADVEALAMRAALRGGDQ